MSKDIHHAIQEMRSQGLSWTAIREKLIEEGSDELLVTPAVELQRREQQARNRNIGMILLGIGSALCFASMVYTFLFGHSYFMLYGLTMIGVCVAFAGLVYIMG